MLDGIKLGEEEAEEGLCVEGGLPLEIFLPGVAFDPVLELLLPKVERGEDEEGLEEGEVDVEREEGEEEEGAGLCDPPDEIGMEGVDEEVDEGTGKLESDMVLEGKHIAGVSERPSKMSSIEESSCLLGALFNGFWYNLLTERKLWKTSREGSGSTGLAG